MNNERSKESTKLVKQFYWRNPDRYVFRKQGNRKWVDFFVKFLLCVCLRHTLVNTVFTLETDGSFYFCSQKIILSTFLLLVD